MLFRTVLVGALFVLAQAGLLFAQTYELLYRNRAQSITVQHTFSPATAQAPFLLSATAQNQTVTGLRADSLSADAVTEAMLKSVNAPTDEYCLTSETTTGDFEWQLCTTTTVSATDRVLGRVSAGAGAIEEITVGGDLTQSGSTFTIAADAVTYAKMQNVSATDRILGRSTAGAGDTEEIPFAAAARDQAQETWADDQVWVADSTTAGTPRTLTNCTDTGGNHLNYTQATNSFSCGTSGDGTGTSITTVRKTAAETVNNSAALQNDDTLLLALAANETWYFTLVFTHLGNATADFQYAFTIPSGATMRYGCAGTRLSITDAVSNCNSNITSGGAETLGGDANPMVQTLVGVVVNGGTAGNLQWQWAQNTATVVDTQVLANSYLEAHK